MNKKERYIFIGLMSAVIGLMLTIVLLLIGIMYYARTDASYGASKMQNRAMEMVKQVPTKQGTTKEKTEKNNKKTEKTEEKNVKNTPKTQAVSVGTVQADKVGPFSRAERQMITDLIHKTIQDGLDGKEIVYPDLKQYPEKWHVEKTVYTTLNIGKKLRGCQGNLNEKMPLLHAIIYAAYHAAFTDPRFPALTKEDFENPEFNFYISIFGDQKEVSFKKEQDVVEQLVPFKYGIILQYISDEGKEQLPGIFLPSVWKKYPEVKNFWKHLKKKARKKARLKYYPKKFRVFYFPAEIVRNLDFIGKQDEQRIDMALSAFKTLFQKDGHVRYEIDFKKGKPSKKNHLIREMGSGYGLAYAYFMTHDSESRPLLDRFLKYVDKIAVPQKVGRLVVDERGQIKSGASALALLAILYYEKESGDSSYAGLRKGLKDGLIELFENGVGVHTAPNNPATSPYYDGETWFALSVYNEFFPEDKKLNEVVEQLNETMYDKYSDKYLYNFFHWGTQAAAKQFGMKKSPLMHDYLKKQIKLYVETRPIVPNSASCAYLEGLGEAALALNGVDNELYQKTLERLEMQMDALRILQDIPFKKNEKGKVAEAAKPFLGLFLNRSHEMNTRNDITQHCLSALLKAQKVFKEVP